MLRVFLVSVHETNALREALETLARLDRELSRCCGVRIGLLANWLKWRYRLEWLVAAKRRYGLIVYVDSGGFQGRVEPEEYAGWLCRYWRLVDVVFAPDDPVLLCGDPLDEQCRRRKIWRTMALAVEFAQLVTERCPGALQRLSLTLQGLTPDEYMECYQGIIDMLGSVGVEASDLNPLITLGSLKLRSWRSRVAGLRGTIAEVVSEINLKPLHLLGVHGRDLHKVLNNANVHSADTGAQGLNYILKHRDVLGCERLGPECYARAVEREVFSSLEPLLKLSKLRTLDKFIPTAVERVAGSAEAQGA
ncbi:hypothetical protein Pyrfu_0359 [Pyrolobus fumarii 1A]|uniref:Uncharacterized protein n=1 Tax=Pyrolobus fumarii (strain DSM 11204 / 1A) TaxID=694429 RepID=G0EFR0_PYRF1|nr:hypothetical protein [Pyrolobus fumarii]AEM38231.1 hypothetical protein Pyrfu_0359 [Pyrolobus fumarii 1A]